MNIYERITNLILEVLGKGEIPWQRPWYVDTPKNLITKREYRGINRLLLGMAGFSSPWFLSFLQVKKLNGSVKRGEKGNLVVFYGEVEIKKKPTEKEEVLEGLQGTEVAETEVEKKVVRVLKYSYVFNVEQCDLPEKVTKALQDSQEKGKQNNQIENCEAIVVGMPNPPKISFGYNMACYVPSHDVIEMPHRNKFMSSEFYYSTLFHELVHSTGHSKRVGRELTGFFGSEKYTKEELIAEIGSSFLCNRVGIAGRVFDNSIAYIQGWSEVLKKDKKLILEAASQSQKAVDYILGGKND